MQEEMIREIEARASEVSDLRCDERFLVAAARFRSGNLHLGKRIHGQKLYGSGFVNIKSTETEYFFGNVPQQWRL